ncbi:glycosyltransferase [Methylobacterium sp. A54F]
MAKPFASIIIPLYNDLANLDTCLDLLRKQSYPADCFEIIVADNNSACGLAAVETTVAGRAKVIPAPEQGAGLARNTGAAAAVGCILAFIDSDCRPDPDWLRNGVRALENAHIIGGKVVVEPLLQGSPNPVELFEMIFSFRFEHYINNKGFTGSGNMFVHTHIFWDIGGFRGTVSEDVEWCQRARQRNYTITYVPDVIVAHPARHTWGELVRKFRRTTLEAYALERERRFWRVRWFLRSLLVLFSPTLHGLKIARARIPCSPTIRLRCIMTLIAIRYRRFLDMNKILLGMGDTLRTK